MIKTDNRTIGDLDFTVTQLPASKGYPLFFKLLKHLGPVLAPLLGQFGDLDPKMDVKAALKRALPSIVMALASVDPLVMEQLGPELLANTQVNLPGRGLVQLNNIGNRDLVFSGRIKTMLLAIVHSIEVNFADFIEGNEPAVPQSLETASAS